MRYRRNIHMRVALPCLGFALMALGVDLLSTEGWSREEQQPSFSSLSARGKLDRLLQCRQAERDSASAARRAALDSISNIETFIRSLTDKPVHAAAHDRADLALRHARAALEKSEARIQLADQRLDMTVRALKYLAPEHGGIAKALSSDDARRDAINRASDAEKFSRGVDDYFGGEFGFENDPVLLQRLSRLIARLQISSTRLDVPVEVRVISPGSGTGALASATTIYFDKDDLDKQPSDSELLFIAAHELAHVQLGHYGETLIGIDKEKAAIANKLGPEGWDALGWWTERAMIKMKTGPWEQRQEEEADLWGAEAAIAAGASPKGVHEAMLRMEAEENANASRVAPDIQKFRDSLRDHAAPMERLRTLERKLGNAFWERTDLEISGGCPS